MYVFFSIKQINKQTSTYKHVLHGMVFNFDIAIEAVLSDDLGVEFAGAEVSDTMIQLKLKLARLCNRQIIKQ